MQKATTIGGTAMEHEDMRAVTPSKGSRWLQRVRLLLSAGMLLVAGAAAIPAFGAGGDVVWRYSDTLAGKQDARASVVDSQGHTIITGAQNLSGGIDDDYLTTKIKADGSGIAWRAVFDKAGGTDQATAAVIDHDDNVIVTGLVWNGINNDIHTIKYDGVTGAVLWQHTFNGAAKGNDVGTSLAVDTLNNIYVGGYSQDANGNNTYLILKYTPTGPNPDGTPAWRIVADGGAMGINRVNSITAGNGGVAVTGQTWGGSSFDCLTIKYDYSGAKLWEQRHSAGAGKSSIGKIVAMDPAGNVVFTGSSDNGTDLDIYTAKYNGTTGSRIWERTYNGAFDDEPNGMVIGPNGNVYLTGYTWTITAQNDFYTAKYNGATGALVWDKLFNSTNGNDDITAATGIVIDPAGDVFVTGYTITGKNYDIQTVKYKKDNGNQLWQKSFDGAALKNDRPIGIGLSPTGEVLVAGWTDTAANDLDYIVLKYDPGLLDPPTSVSAVPASNSSITLTWVDNSANEDGFAIERCQNAGCTSFTEIATTPAGATSFTDSGLTSNTYYSYRIRAFSGASGYSRYGNTATSLTVVVNFVPPAWKYAYDGSAHNDDYANAIAVGPDNHPVVAGQTNDYPEGYTSGLTSFDYLVQKLNRADMSVTWSGTYNDPTDSDDIATCVAVDSNNSIVVSGYAWLYNGVTRDVNSLYTIRYPLAGDPVGDQYNAPVPTGASDDRGLSVAIASSSDTSNNAAVVGFGKNAAGNDDIYVLKYNPNGTRAWASAPFDGNGGDDFPSSVLIAPDGSIYVTGYSEKTATSNTYHFFTAKYNGATGARIWTDLYSVTETGDNRGSSLVLDDAGDLYVTGSAVTATGTYDIYTMKYSGSAASAQRLWERSIDGIAGGNDAGVGIKFDAVDGAIVVAGTTLSTKAVGLQPAESDFTLVRYSAAGDTVWTKTYQRPQNDDIVKSVAMDTDGNIYVAGNTSNGLTTDSLTVKFDYMGTIAAATLFNGVDNSFDESSAIVVNGLNEAFVAGYTENADGDADVLVYKIAPDTSVPSPPYRLTTAPGYSTVALSWTAPPGSRDGIRVERKVGACSSMNGWEPLASLGGSQLTFTDTGLNSAATYCYRVQNFLSSGAVSRWAVKQATTLAPPAPGTISASASSTTRVNVTWSDTTTGETGFKIERCSGDGCTEFVTVGTTGSNTTSYADNAVCGGSAYRYRVLAYGPGWESPPATTSGTVTTPSPAAPALTAARVSEAAIRLNWTDPNSDETGYVIERCIGDGCTGLAQLATLGSGAILFNDTGLSANTTYVYRVKGYKTAGCTWETASATASATTTLNPPSGLIATAASTTSVNLSWTDNTATETGFSIEKCVGSGCVIFDATGSVGSNVTSYTDTTACFGENVTYKVKATRAAVTLSNSGGSCWTRRTPIVIANFQPNFQTKITLPFDGDMQSSFADIRFVDTTANLEVPYWIESKSDGASATVWIKTGMNNSISLYFGNASATSSSNGTQVFEFFDEFDGATLDTAKWSATGAYSLSGGALRVDTGSVFTNATIAASPQNRVFEMKSQWLTGASSYSGLNIANAQSTQGNNSGSNALAYFITDGGTTANLLPFGATGTAASYNIASGTLTSNVSTGGALYNPFLYDGQYTRKPSSGVWSPPGGGNITRIRITNESESGYDYYHVYNASGTLLWRGAGSANTWLDIAPTTGIYTVFSTDGSVQRGVGGDVPEVIVDGITAVNALNNYRIVGFEFREATQTSYFVKELNYTDLLRKTYSGTWNSAPYLWLGYYSGAAAGSTNGDDMLTDWVRVRKFAATEPTATFGGKETSTCFTFGSPWEGAYSNTASATTSQPTTPVLTATRVSEGQINLSWSDANTDRSGFSIERCAGEGCSDFAPLGGNLTSATTTFSDTGLTPNTSYSYRVTAFKTASCGWIRTSLPATAVTTLYEPNNIGGTVNSTTQITVTWTDRTLTESGFKIERCQGAGCANFALVGTAAANATSWIDTGVTEGLLYRYQVRATSTTPLWDSSPSTIIERTTPAASPPVLTSATRASEVQINLVWTDSNTDRTGFRLYRCAGEGCSSFAQVGGTITATSYNDTGLTPNTSYTYYVETFKTVTTERWAKQSGTRSATATLLEPNSVTATANSTTQITLAWADRTSTETGFRIERCQGSDCTNFTEITPAAAANATSYADAGVCEALPYRYQIRATNGTWFSTYSTPPVGATTPAAAAPVLSATTPSEVEVTLTWSDPNSDETEYRLERCAGAGCSNFTLLTTKPANSTTHTDTGLTSGTSYTYMVKARKNATCAWEKASNPITMTPQVAGPAALTAITASTTGIDLAWTRTTTSETGFEVERCTGTGCSDFTKIHTTAAGATAYTDTSVCNGFTYSYRVRAVNSTVPWNSGYSNTAKAITLAKSNLLADPGFENTTSGWPTAVGTLTGTTFDSTNAYDGAKSLKLSAAGTTLGRSQAVTVTAGRQYVLSAWLNAALTAGRVQCDVSGTGIDSAGILVAFGSENNNAGWVSLSETVTIPAGTTTVNIRCFADSAPQGTASIDGVAFAPASFNLTATRVNETRIDLSWLDSVVDETGYRIERCAGTDCVNYSQIGTTGANATTYSNTGLTAGTLYRYRVAGYKSASCSWDGSYSITAEATTTIAAPTGVSATPSNTTSVNVSWTDNTVSETGFRIRRCEGAGFATCTEVGTTGAGIATYADTTAANATAYQYSVQAYSSLGWSSAYSTPASATTPAPVKPVLTPSVQSETRINLSWTDGNNDESGFKVERCTGSDCTGFAQIGSNLAANTTTYSDTTVTSGNTYRYRVSAFKTGSNGWTITSDPAGATTTPPAPTSLGVTLNNTTQVTLSWTNRTTTETGIVIERCQGSTCTDFLPINTAAKGATSYIDSTLCNNQPYRYRVQAVNTSVPWSTDYSNIVSATTTSPSAPTALSVTRMDETRLNLSWTDNTSDETGFKIERCAGAGCTAFTQIGTVAANVKTYSDTGLSGATTYRYQVRAYKTPASGCAWDSGYTAVADGVTTVTAPSGLAATASNSQQINLSWTNNTVSETGYRIERCTGSSCTTFVEIATVTGKATTWSDTTVAHNTAYRYQIRATNGTVPWNSGYGNIATATTPAQAAPTGLAASSIATRVTLTWTDRTSDETGFKIERCQDAGCSTFTEIGQVGANVTTYADSTVCSGTSYTYQVRATRNTTPVYDTPYSTSITATPTAVAAVLTATRSSETQINLSWTNPTTDEDGYKLERCAGSECSTFTQIASLAANAVSYADSGLLPNYTYTYRVKGFNTTAACGWQTTSGSASASTTTVAPTGLTATAAGRSQVNLAWTDTSATETGFKIERCTGSGCTDFIETAVTTGSGTTWSDTNLASSTTYRYRVRATKTTPYAWDSEYSAVVSATTASVPAAPTALSAQSTSSSQINLMWSDGASDATGYRIESCSGAGCSSFSEITAVAVSPKSYSHTGLTADTTYCYRMRSYKTGTGSWTSAYSNTACSSTAIDSPTSLSAAALNSKTVRLMWNDTSADVSGFNIEGQIWNGEWVVITSLGPNVTSYTDTSLIESGRTYSYRIRAFKGGQLSTYSNTVTVKTPAYAPGDAPCLVQDPNAPSITSNPVTTATEGSLYTYQVTATAQGNRTVSYSLPGRPAGMTISAAGLISWTPAFNQSGSQYVTVRATDSGNYSTEQNFMITVTNRNGAPTVTSTAVTTARELHPYSYQVVASDPEADPLMFTLTTAPAGMTISSGGLISWNPGTQQFGDNPVVVQVSDGTLSTTQSFSINVAYNTAPVITSTAPTTGVEGTVWGYQAVVSDPDGDTLGFALNTAPAGMTISSTGLVKWTPTVSQLGDATVTIQVTDGIASIPQTFTITVTGALQ